MHNGLALLDEALAANRPEGGKADAPPVCLATWRENPYRLVSLWDMYQFYAHAMVKLFDELRDIEIQVGRQLPLAPPPAEEQEISKRFVQHLADIRAMCEVLQPRGTPKTGHRWTPENRPTR
jgi:hypothetical protein